MIRFRLIFPVMAAITLLSILTPLLLGLGLALVTFHGKCYGFTDGSWPCTWQEYVSDQVFWASLLEIPLSVSLIPCWLIALGFWIHQRRTTTPEGLPLTLVIFIPVGGCLSGYGLMSLFAVFIRLFYGSYR